LPIRPLGDRSVAEKSHPGTPASDTVAAEAASLAVLFVADLFHPERSRKTVAAIKIATPGPWATDSEKQA